MNERDIFIAALQITDPGARDVFLTVACTEPGQNERLKALLAAEPGLGSFLEVPGRAADSRHLIVPGHAHPNRVGQDAPDLRAREGAALSARRDGDGFQDERSPGPGGTTGWGATVPLETAGTVIGPYKLMEQIGEGGMGLVFVAEQQEPLRRRVALKIIKPGMDSRQVIARFEAERQALAMMDHQNIARVLDAGTTESGCPYFVMELVHGVPVTTYCDANELTTRERLALFVPICQAIQHAHQKGIVHRDIKPSNILVTMYDDKPVPKVIDFGVAKAIEQRLTEKTVYTQFGTLVGTFEYMSPEQAEMNAFGVDTRSDIYSLGVLLYELLTGTTPLERPRLKEAALGEIVRLIKEEDPPPPSVRLSTSGALAKVAKAHKADPAKLSRLIRGELDWVVMKCLEKQRTRRYDSAGSLARDVERYLKDEPIEARPPSAWYRFQKLARRHKVALFTASLVAVALVLGTVVSTWQAFRATVAERTARLSERVAENRKREADEARNLAEGRRDELAVLNENLRRASYVADMNLARVAWDEDNLSRAHELLEKHRPRPGETDLRGFEWHYLRRLFHRDLLTVKAYPGGVDSVAFTPDGKRLVTSGTSRPQQKYLERRLGEVRLWDAATGQPLRFDLGGRADKVARAVLSPDGTHLAATQFNHAILIWDLATGRLVTLYGPETQIAYSIAFSPDGKRLVSMYRPHDDRSLNDSPRSIRIWDLASRQAVVTINGFSYLTALPSLSPDGKLLVAADMTKARVQVWDAATGQEAFSCEYRDGGVLCDAVFSPDGKYLATSWDNAIRFWDVASREPNATWPLGSGGGRLLAFSPDGKRLATVGIGTLELWDTAGGQKVQSFKGHFGTVHSLAFSPDGMRLASGGADGTLRLWDATARPDAVSIPKEGSFGDMPLLSPDGQTLLMGLTWGAHRPIRLWDTTTGEPRSSPIELGRPLIHPAWTADSKRLYIADSGKTVSVMDVAAGKVVRTFPVDAIADLRMTTTRQATALSPDERYYVHAAPDGTIRLRAATTGVETRMIRGLGGAIEVVAFSPDGSRLLGANTEGAVVIWEVATGLQIAATELTGLRIRVARFSADGKQLAVAGILTPPGTGDVRILEAQTVREVWSLKGHTLQVNDAIFSADGRRLVTASADRTIRIWDLGTGQEILKLSDASGRPVSVRFAADGRRLISTSLGGRPTNVWDATPLP
jgi:eukaryotic-like serine/threonine-protein kinase